MNVHRVVTDMDNFNWELSANSLSSELSQYVYPRFPSGSEDGGFHGGLIKSSGGGYICLRHYHTFGRSMNCHAIFPTSDISRIHMAIFWKGNHWYIRDKSKNGVWVNNQRIIKNEPCLLEESDTIMLSSITGETLTLISARKPCDTMVSVNPQCPPFHLNKPITVISDSCFLLYDGNNWSLHTSEDKEAYREIYNGEVISLFGEHYYLQSAQEEFDTLQNHPIARSVDDLVFYFEVSEDEEEIRLKIADSEQSSVIKGERLQNQLYLLLCLARKSIADCLRGYSQNNRGWYDLNELSKALGIKPDNTRIRVHRLRHRLGDVIDFNDIDACQIVQLQEGSVRINSSKLIIVKGGKPEIGSGCS